MEKQLIPLLAQGKLKPTLMSLMAKGHYATVAALLNVYGNHLKLNILLSEDVAADISNQQKALDVFQSVMEGLPQEQRPVFLCLAYKGMDLSFSSLSADEFVQAANFMPKPEAIKAVYNALSTHPFIKSVRETIKYAPREDALEMLRTLWAQGDRAGFLYGYDVLAGLQDTMQRKHDPDLTEEKFTDQLAAYPDLQLVILSVTNGNAWGSMSGNVKLPPLRIVISNKWKPVDYSPVVEDAKSQGAWANDAADFDFCILTADGEFKDLKSYMHASLKDRTESSGHGPYNFASNDDRTFGTAANVMAALQRFNRVPRNSVASAQERISEQVKSIALSAFAPIYMNRFLRAQEWSSWTAALSLVNSGRREKAEMLALIDYKTAAETLVTHGLVGAVDSIEWVIGIDAANIGAACEGYLTGMQQLYVDLVELARPGDEIHAGDALDRFERTRGFHPDVHHFPVLERKKLAFQDISDIIVGHLGGHLMTRFYVSERYERETTVSELALIEETKKRILSQVPFVAIFDTLVKAGDVTNFMRLYEHQKILLGKDFHQKKGRQLDRIIAREGFTLTPEGLSLARFNHLPCRAVISHDATYMIRAGNMMRFKTVDQIVSEGNLMEALWAHEIIESIKLPERVREQYDAQLKMLTDYFEKVSFTREFRAIVASFPEADRDVYVGVMKQLLPHLASQIAEAETLGPEQAQRLQETVSGAFDVATGKVSKPRFARVLGALARVAPLFPGLRR